MPCADGLLGNLSSRALGDDTSGQLFFFDCSNTIEPSTSRTCLLFGIPVCVHCFAPFPDLPRVQDKLAAVFVVPGVGAAVLRDIFSRVAVYNPRAKNASDTIQTQQRQRTVFYILLQSTAAAQQLTDANIPKARPCRRSCRI